jgi:hypothetical protein
MNSKGMRKILYATEDLREEVARENCSSEGSPHK